MSPQELFYLETGRSIEGAVESQMFGKPCFKINGKAFISFFQDAMVFKLDGQNHAEALALGESRMFDPSGKGRPMKEWVQVTFDHKDRWREFALAAFRKVNG
ncbi:MAG: hypothetical protein ACM3N9_07180 [Syntrophothermus sp.]